MERNFASLDQEERAELWATLALQSLPGIGGVRGKKLVEAFGSPFKAVEAVAAWDDAGIGFRTGESGPAAAFKKGAWRAKARVGWARVRESACGLLLWSDADYPAYLKEIPDAPLALFYYGDRSLFANPAVAMVGARNCTREGLAVAAHIARGLSAAGVTVISGMAMGIDRVAHLCGLEGVGSSIAVLGSGADVPSPACNRDLYALLRKNGLVVSEFIPGSVARPESFPIRNRLISGLSYGVVVLEAALRSGTLVTARHATEQDRQVFAVPGSSLAGISRGCQELIRRGARPIFSAEDILEDLAPLLKIHATDALKAYSERKEKAEKQRGLAARDATPEEYSLDLPPLHALPPSFLPWEATLSEYAPDRARPTPGEPAVMPGESARARDGGAPVATRLESVAFSETVTSVEPASSSAVASSSPCPAVASDDPVLLCLANGPLHIDEMGRRLDCPPSRLSGILVQLEISGKVVRKPGMHYALT